MEDQEISAASFGAAVRRTRLAQGLSIEALAEQAMLAPNFISSIERGERDPSLGSVIKIADGLGVHPGTLLGGVTELREEGIEAARLFQESAPEVQGSLLKILRGALQYARGRRSGASRSR